MDDWIHDNQASNPFKFNSEYISNTNLDGMVNGSLMFGWFSLSSVHCEFRSKSNEKVWVFMLTDVMLLMCMEQVTVVSESQKVKI